MEGEHSIEAAEGIISEASVTSHEPPTTTASEPPEKRPAKSKGEGKSRKRAARAEPPLPIQPKQEDSALRGDVDSDDGDVDGTGHKQVRETERRYANNARERYALQKYQCTLFNSYSLKTYVLLHFEHKMTSHSLSNFACCS